jgi:hypothetical protein
MAGFISLIGRINELQLQNLVWAWKLIKSKKCDFQLTSPKTQN